MQDYRSDASRGIIHSSELTEGLKCDGRPCFEVVRSGRRIFVERYWCARRHRMFDPWRDACDEGFEMGMLRGQD